MQGMCKGADSIVLEGHMLAVGEELMRCRLRAKIEMLICHSG